MATELTSVMGEFAPHFNGKVIEIRAMGYDLIAAILELTDNSVRMNCGSKFVRVILHKDGGLLHRVSILDDGSGMVHEKLKESFIFNLMKEREDGDIGKYHVGMKYALIALGSQITILSRVANGCIVGIFADIDQMAARNSFKPCEVSPNVDEEWALRHITPALWQEFCKSSSGTLVDVKNLVPRCRNSFDKMTDEVKKGLKNSYTSLYNSCTIRLENEKELIAEIIPSDMFYDNKPENLEEPAHETTLYVYTQGIGRPDRVIEKNQQRRPLSSTHTKECTTGTPTRPVYYEFTEYVYNKKGGRPKANIQIINTLPDEADLIATLDVRVIQVNSEIYDAEKELFPDGNKLALDRMGFWFQREIRCVGAAKQLGSKLNSRSSGCSLRQRMLIKTSSKADELIGSKFNKQMDDNALPCRPLNDALLNIYSAVIRPWDTKYNELAAKVNQNNKKPAENSENEAETEAEAEAEVVNDNGGLSDGSTSVENLVTIDIIHSNPPSPPPSHPTEEAEAEQAPTENAEAKRPVPAVVTPVEPPRAEETFTFSSSASDNLIIVTDGDTVTKFPYYTEQPHITKDFVRGTKEGLGDVRFRKWLKVFAALQQKV
jgi:hypothetical protein